MSEKRIRFGIIGLGLMGREFGSAAARWCNITEPELPRPEITGICDMNKDLYPWFTENFSTVSLVTDNYKELIESDEIDAVYCAVPHNLHQQMYVDIIQAGKHLMGEKPFGIDRAANDAIMEVIRANPDVFVRCSSEFPFFPGAQRLIQWLNEKKYGRIMEVRAGFHHSSDMDLTKAINWKRMIDINGEYGCMGDLGLHTQHIPLRMGWVPQSVFADLQNIAEERPGKDGTPVPCETWDNAVITCCCTDSENGKPFSMVLETKRMAPGQTNTWFIEVYGTDGSAKFSTRDPKAFRYSETIGKEQPWSRIDVGMSTVFPVVTGGIFEFGFSDAIQQMFAAFLLELSGAERNGAFGCVTPEETAASHQILTAALTSFKEGRRVEL
mgnify:CR=1 FL=1